MMKNTRVTSVDAPRRGHYGIVDEAAMPCGEIVKT